MTASRASWSIRALFVALALTSACKVNESGNIPCSDDSNCPTDYPQCIVSSGKCTAAVIGTPGLGSTALTIAPAAITGGTAATGAVTLALPALTGDVNLARKLTLGISSGGSAEPVVKSGGATVTLADLGKTITIDAPPTTATDSKTYTYTLTVSNDPGSTASITATGTLTVVPAPALASSALTISPTSITGGLAPPISVTLPALTSAAGSASSVSLVLSGCGSGGVTKSDGSALTAADLGTTVTVAAPSSSSSDTQTCTYTLVVSNAATTPASASATGTLQIAPFVIGTQPVNTTAAIGGSASFSVSATTAQGTLSYQWQKDGSNLPGKTGSTLTINPVAAADAGLYAVVVKSTLSGSTISITSNSVSLNVAPAITAQPANTSASVGGSASFAVTASVSQGSLSYQWQKDGVDLAGQTAAALSLNPVAAGDVGMYSVNVTSTFNGTTIATTSGSASLNVAPVISTQPANVTASVGGTASFTVVASIAGGALSYQWQKGAVDVPGGNGATLTITPVAAADAGSYSVKVTSTFNSTTITTTSGTASLNIGPTITAQPMNKSASVGTSASFSVTATATGGGTLSYQWKKDGADIGGATSSTFSIGTVAAGDVGLYTVLVTNTLNSTTASTLSSAASLNVAPQISGQPVSVAAAVGAAASFSVTGTVSGTATLSYQWRKGGAAIPGATSASYTIDSVAAGDAATNYTVDVISNFNSTTATTSSNPTTLNVAAGISGAPTNQTALLSAAASFSVTATANAGATLTYQWRKDGANLSGKNAATLSIASAVATDTGMYDVVITSSLSGTQVNTTSVPVSLNVAPSIPTPPTSQTAALGASASFTAAGSIATIAGDTLSYQWQKGGVDISGATSATYTIAAAAKTDAGTYSVKVISNFNSTTSINPSSPVTLNVAPTIDTAPTNQTASVSGSASFTVAASVSAGTLTYQWQKNNVDISGKTSATLTIGSVAATDTAMYQCVITSTLNSTTITNTTIPVSLNVAPQITGQPSNATAAVGDAASFTVTATIASVSGDTLSYQWQHDGVDIVGATSATYSIATVAATDAGFYKCNVSSNYNSTIATTASSSTKSLNVAPVISLGGQPANQTASVGGTASFTVTATVSQGTINYQWQKNGTNIGGGTSATLTLNPVAANDAAMYQCVVTTSFNSTTSPSTTSTAASLNVAPVITNPNQPTPEVAAQGGSAGFSVTATIATVSGDLLTYQWQKNGATLGNGGNVSGATTSALTFSTVGLSDVALYSVVATSTYNGTTANTTSLAVPLTVDNALASAVQRVGLTATLLPNGKVLLAGGGNKSGNGSCSGATTKVEIFDPATGVSSQLGGATPAANQQLTTARCQHAAVLVNGASPTVYFFGGETANTNVDVFDVNSSTFLTTGLPTLQHHRIGPLTATLLGASSSSNSGNIIIAGGYSTATHNPARTEVELFVPAAGSSTSTDYANVSLGAGAGRGDSSATLVGKWLFLIGGLSGDTTGFTTLSSVDAIDTSAATSATGVQVTSTPTNSTARWGHSAVALSNGTSIVVLGGASNGTTELKSMQTYTVDTSSGNATAATVNVNMSNTRLYFPVLPAATTDKFVVFGGLNALGTTDTGTTSIELIDATNPASLATSSYRNATALSVARLESAGVVINNGGSNAFFIAGGNPGAAAAAGTHEVIVDQ